MGAGVGDGEVVVKEGVEEGGLSHIRSADYRHEAGAERTRVGGGGGGGDAPGVLEREGGGWEEEGEEGEEEEEEEEHLRRRVYEPYKSV